MSISLHQLAQRIGAQVIGDGSVKVSSCAAIGQARPDQVTFLSNPKYAEHLQTTQAGAVVIDSRTDCPDHVNRLVADDPYFAFRNAVVELHGFRRHPEWRGQSSEVRDQRANIGEGSVIHPMAVVESSATIGRNCVLYPGVYIGEQAVIGDDCVLYPNVVIYDRCVLGRRVTLHSGTVIGHDGFGYATHKGAHHKIPQTGIVVIEDDVELGAGCAIERAAVGETRIGQGTKFADLISIGHGSTIGKHCLFVSLVGVSGSVQVGDYVMLGGQVGIAGHLKIGKGVQAAARTAIAQDVAEGMKVGGIPAIPLDQAKRNALAAIGLYDLFKRVRRLERELERLQNEK